MPSKKLNELIQSTLTGKEIAELPTALGFSDNKWINRKINNPGSFTLKELGLLAKALRMTRHELLNEYGVGRLKLTVAEADAIHDEESLTATGQPADALDGASAGRGQHTEA